MAGKAGLKAGLIGGAIMLVLTLLNMIPAFLPAAAGVLGCVCCTLELLVYIGAGVVAGFFLTAPRTAGAGAGAGAIAGLISGVGGWLGDTITSIVEQVTGVTAQQTEQAMQLLERLFGVDLGSVPVSQPGWGSVALGSGMCCVGSLVIGAALGAVGGAIFGAAKSED